MRQTKKKPSGNHEIRHGGPFGCWFFAIVRDMGGGCSAVACGIDGEDAAAAGDPRKGQVIREAFRKFQDATEAKFL